MEEGLCLDLFQWTADPNDGGTVMALDKLWRVTVPKGNGGHCVKAQAKQ